VAVSIRSYRKIKVRAYFLELAVSGDLGGSMAYSIARLTLYALLTAIESDFRDTIIDYLLPNHAVNEVLPGKIYDRARDRMERDRGFDPDLETKVLEYLDFTESIEVLWSHRKAYAVASGEINIL
jgi:hypothetical protein